MNKSIQSNKTDIKRQLLARKLAQRNGKNFEEVTIPERPSGGEIPISPHQTKLFLLNSLNPESTAYNLVSTFKLKGDVDTRAFIDALNHLESRHEVLRTVFRETGDQKVIQRVLAARGAPVEIIDCRDQVATKQNKVDEIVNQEANICFDFTKGPLWKVSLLRCTNQEWLLIINVHHIIFDGWSLGVFVTELLTCYGEIKERGFVSMAPLSRQYADYTLWNIDRLNGQLGQTQTSFWRDYLDGFPNNLALPYDYIRSDSSGSKGATTTLVLDVDLFNQFRDIGKSHGITPYNMFMAALVILLNRYTGENKITLGSPVSCRDVEDTQPLIGILSNTIPVAIDLDVNDTFSVFLKKLAGRSAQALQHPDLPFDSIVELIKPDRSSGANPIFQVFYAYQMQVNPDAKALSGLDLLYEIRDYGTTKFDLSLDVMEGPEGPSCIFEYDTSLFTDQKIHQMVNDFQKVIEQIAYQSSIQIKQIKCESDDIHAQFSEYELPSEFDTTFAQRFKSMVTKFADQEALVFGDQRLTYQQLDELSSKLAHSLYRYANSSAVSAIVLPKGIELISTILACQKSGCGFVLLDPSFPIERLNSILSNSDVSTVISSQILLDDAACSTVRELAVMGKSKREILDYDYLLQTDMPVNSVDLDQLLTSISPGSPAYVMYTSGTTAEPKGVLVTQRNWMNALYGWQQAYGLDETTKNHLQMANYTFDVFCGDLIRALGSGGKLVLCEKEIMGQPEHLFTLIEDEKIHCAEFVPAVFRPLARYLQSRQATMDSLNILIVASDSWYQEECEQFASLIRPDAQLINSYGMVEATIDSTWFVTNQDARVPVAKPRVQRNSEKQSVPVGSAFDNVDVLVCDQHMRVCPSGVPGEICVGGLGVVDGYINQPELTHEKFVPHPFRANEKIYKTGDWGVMSVDQNLILSGRRDHQVKVRGQRIELGDIESQLAKHPGVQQAVAGTFLSGEQTELITYLVFTDSVDKTQQIDSLKQTLSETLPLYMVPNTIVALDEFPLSKNGKIDRKKISDDHANQQQAVEFTQPQTLTEEIVAGVWCDALNIDRVSVNANFFSLGGHSLTALQVCGKLKQLFDVPVSVNDIFMNPVVRDLSKRIQSLTDSGSSTKDEKIIPHVEPKPEQRFEPFPLTEIQQAYWLGRSDIFEFGNISAHSYDEFEVQGVDTQRLQVAWNKVIQKHDMLRCVVLSDGTQQILENVTTYSIQEYDHTDSNVVDIDEHFMSIRNDMSHQIIDVQQWPNFDLRVSKLPSKKARLHFSTDAIMFDVRSFLIILTDLMSFYMDDSCPVEIPTFSFRDYVVAERVLKQTENYQQAKQYWHQKVIDMPPAPQLPQAKNPNQVTAPKFTRLHMVLPKSGWDVLKKRASQHGITPTGLLLAAYAETLAQHSREPHFSLNLTFLNRKPFHPEVDNVVGEFTSLTMLAVDNRKKSNHKENLFIARARAIQSDLWKDLEQNDVDGIEVLRQLSRISGDSARAKMPVVFTSALVMDVPTDVGMKFKPIHIDGITQTSQVWLDCGVWEEEGQLLCNWDVVKEMYPDGFIESAFAEFEALIQRLVDNEKIWSSDVTQDTSIQQHQTYPCLVEPEPIGQPKPTLVSLFLDRVEEQPDALAVVSGAERLTYSTLADRAAWLAMSLRDETTKRCVDKGELVAIVLDKGHKQVSSTLGVMMAGAAYLPIDPDIPDARIKVIVEQAEVTHIVTQERYYKRMMDCELFGSDQFVVHQVNEDRQCVDELNHDHFPTEMDLAYVIFTSGSTGKPKGVIIDHRGVSNTVEDMNRRFNVTKSDSVLAVSALNFDLSVYDFFGLLAAGGSIVIPQNQRRLDPSHWYELVTENEISLWNSVPALVSVLSSYVEAREFRLDSLRHIFMSGDWIPLTLPDRLWACSNANLTSLGGATEASIWSILHPINSIDPDWQSIPYGKAMFNQRTYVLDHQLNPCPNWVEGDIYIGGIGLALGYWKDKEKTDAVFMKHPVSHAPLYKTGDRGRLHPDGNIEFLGRSDFQVKVQGHRIELGEIEHAFRQVDGVEDVIVSVIGEKENAKSLVAYIVTGEQNRTNEIRQSHFINTCRSALTATLPRYMVPRHLLLLDELPLTANGKIDRKSLPSIESADDQKTNQEYVAPSNQLQTQLANIWENLLELNQVGIRDNFFRLGGDSMKALEMLVKINQLDPNRQPIGLGNIMTNETIEKLSVEISKNQILSQGITLNNKGEL